MLHLITCHGRIMPHLAELLFCYQIKNIRTKFMLGMCEALFWQILARLDILLLINWKESLKIKSLIIKAMYFSILFGMTSIFLLNFPISCMIRWLSYPRKLWNITEILYVNLNDLLHVLWANPLQFPVTWQWSLTGVFSFVYFLLHIWRQRIF